MKTIYLKTSKAALATLSLIIAPYFLHAQTGMGVGTSTPAEKLDVNGAVKIGTTNTTNAGTIRWTGTEFQGYDGSQWLNFGGGSAGWSLTGNSGTNANTNFVGTTDNNGLAFRTNNTERMRLKSNGNLGIGTTNPSGTVEIYNTTANLRITDSDDNSSIVVVAPGGSYTGGIGTTTNHDLPFFTNNTDRMIITTSGNVGIGTSSPNYEIQVRGGNDNTWMQFSTNATGNGALDGFLIGVHETNNDVHLIQREASSMIFRTNNTEAMRIDNQGDVGIGTNNPIGKVHFEVTNGSYRMWDNSAYNNTIMLGGWVGNNGLAPQVRFQETGVSEEWDIGMNANNEFAVELNDVSRLMIDNTGNVGIGTTAPQEKVHIRAGDLLLDRGNSGNVTRSIILQGAGAYGTDYFGELMFKGYDNSSGSFEYEGAAIKARNLGSVNNGALTFWTRDTSLVEWMILNKNGVLQINPNGYAGNSGLSIDGSFKLENGSQASGYVLQSDANGTATWVDPTTINDNDWLTNSNDLYNGNSGNVGVGTNTPQEKLHVNGGDVLVDRGGSNNVTRSFTLQGAGAVGTSYFGELMFKGYDNTSGSFEYEGAAIKARNLGSNNNGALTFWTRDTSLVEWMRLTKDGILQINPNGNSGNSGLRVDGSFRLANGSQVNGYVLQSDASGNATWVDPASISDGDWAKNGTHIYNANTGNVGIGTNNPESSLNVKVNNNGLNTPLTLRNGNDNQSGGNAVGIAFTNNNGSAAPKAMIVNERTTGWGKGSLHFLLNDDNNASAATLSDARMTITRIGNVGIGTTNPSDELEVQGSIRMVDGNQANGYIAVSNTNGTMTWTDPSTITTADDWSANGSHIYNANSGNVGIGTSSPNFELHIHDNSADNSWLQFTQASTGTNSSTDGLLIGIDNSERAVFQNRENTDMIFQTNSTEQVRITAAGNVGIGTGTPESLLNLKVSNNGLNTPLTIRNGNDTQSGGNAVGIAFSNNNGSAAPKAMIVNERTTGWGKGAFHFLLNEDNNASAATMADAKMTITNNGNVGIGTTSPSDELEVQGSIRMVDGNQANGYIPVSNANGTMTWTDPTTIATADDGDWTISGSNQYSAVSGNVGIGVSAPAEKLHTSNGNVLFDRDTDNSNTARTLTIAGKLGGDVYPYASIDFRNYDDNNGNVDYVGASIRSHNEGSSDDGDLRFYTTSDQTLTEAVRIDRNGNVGIGTTSPADELEVQGSIRMVDGNQANGYIPVSNANGTMTWTDPTTIATADDGDWTVNGNDQYSSVSGNVGVGSSAPGYKLDVNGTFGASGGGTFGNNVQITGNYYLDNTNGTGTNNPDFRLDGYQDKLYLIAENGTNGSTIGTEIRFRTASANSSASDRVVINKDGNVGIGTTNPSEMLYLRRDGSDNFIRIDSRSNNSGYAGIRLAEPGLEYGWSMRFDASPAGGLHFAFNDNAPSTTDRVTILPAGNVGVGTTTPADKLEIQGSIRMVDGNQANGYIPVSNANGTMTWTDPTTIATADDGDWTISGNNQYSAVSGNVGVGVNTPTEKLHVSNGDVLFDRDTNNNNTIRTLTIAGKLEGNVYPYASIDFRNYDFNDGDADYVGASIRSHNEGASDDGDLRFYTTNDQTLTEAVRISRNGNVGIGTTSPSSALYVAANSANGPTVTIETGSNQYPSSLRILPSTHATSERATVRIGEWGLLQDIIGNGNENFAIYNNNTNSHALSIDAGNKVGVGTTSPDWRFSVSDSEVTAGFGVTTDGDGIDLIWKNYGGVKDLDFRFQNGAGTIDTTLMTIKGNGGYNVGIGELNPDEKLHVAGNIRMVDGNQAAGYIPVSDASGTMTWTDPTTIATADDGDWLLNGNKMYNGNSGNVGIGTSNPSATLEVYKAVAGLKVTDSDDNATIGMAAPNGSSSTGGIGTLTNHSLPFFINNTDRMILTTTGNLGIGTTSPGDKLHVAGNIRMVDGSQAAGYIPVSDANGTMTWTDPTTIATADDGDWTVNGNDQYSSVSGNVGIGTNIPAAVLNVYEPDENSTQTNFTQAVNNAGLLVTTQYTNGTYTPGIFWNTSNNNSGKPKAGIYTQNTNSGTKLLFGTSNLYSTGITSTGMVISEDGKVGIGTLSPIDRFEVYGSIRMVDGNQQNGYVAVSDANGTMSWADPATLSDGDWSTNGNHIYNANSGNVGIGTTSPSHEMQIHDATNDNSWLQFTQASTGSSSSDGFVIGVNNSEEVHLNQKENNDMVFKTNNSEKMRIMASGNVGIGTSNPTNALLEVDGSVGSHSLSGIGYLNTGGSGTGTYNGSFSIYASNRISGFAFIAHSDERIKDIKGISNSTDDLETLKKIEITDYQYIDKIGKGDGMQKKLIAQQVEEVYPQAVETNVTEVVPDIYEKASIKDGWVSLSTDLKVGDKVQLVLENGDELLEVKETSENGFKVELDNDGDVFVYGRQVDDFHTVDYEAISMLNVSATQELAKRLEESEAKNLELEEKLKILEAQLMKEKNNNQARLERLEAELGMGLSTQK